MKLLGVDTGGTFTDFVFFDGSGTRIHKVLSTPSQPEMAILQGVYELGLDDNNQHDTLYIIHGSTVATNAVLEGKGVKTAFITNSGMRDLLTIGRQTREQLYQLCPQPVPSPVPEDLCFELAARVDVHGNELSPLDAGRLEALVDQLRQAGVKAVAINMLFSYVNDVHEKEIEARLPDDMFVSRSSAVLPEYREYERGMATWLNAWVGPIMQGYLARLQDALRGSKLSIMQSSGGTIDARLAGKQAVHLLLSGPAGGMAGARYIASRSGHHRLLTFDMGGTSTDVAMIDGDIQLTSEGKVGRYPVAVPMVDMHTIGAGGGSIASVDEGGLFHVGPESAGADPGPACYAQGGKQPTVTDANLVLGRIRADAFLGGDMHLDVDAAQQAIGSVAQVLNLGIEETARGIISLVNENMVRALRVMSVQRGVDPSGLILVSFGGAGGLHVCALADALKIRKAIIPVHAGVLSALGMLVAPRSRQLSRSVIGPLDRASQAQMIRLFEQLAAEGQEALAQEGVTVQALHVQKSVDLRYQGQSFYLNIKCPETVPDAQLVDELNERFHAMHQQVFSHALAQPVELVNVRVEVSGPARSLDIVPQSKSHSNAGQDGEVRIVERASLSVNETITGPALITETVSTTWLDGGWQCHADQSGNLILDKA